MKKQKKNHVFLSILGGATLTVAGVLLIPPFLEKCNQKMYKVSNKNFKEEINQRIEYFEPKVVRKEK